MGLHPNGGGDRLLFQVRGHLEQAMHLTWDESVAFDQPGSAALNTETEELLSRLSVQVESFMIGKFPDGGALGVTAADQITVLYVVEGEGALQWDDAEVVLVQGIIALIPSQLEPPLPDQHCAKHSGDTEPWASAVAPDYLIKTSGSLVIASATVSANAGHGLGYFQSLDRPLVEDSSNVLLGQIFHGILSEMATPDIGSRCIVESLIKQVLIVLLRRTLLHKQIATPLYLTIADPRMAAVINRIQMSHSERLSISALAKTVGMTPLGLTSEFKAIFGESLIEYIQSVRLRHANDLLKQTDLPIKSIAASVGFASRSHFSRAFRKLRGQDPTVFRKSA